MARLVLVESPRGDSTKPGVVQVLLLAELLAPDSVYLYLGPILLLLFDLVHNLELCYFVATLKKPRWNQLAEIVTRAHLWSLVYHHTLGTSRSTP